MHEQNADKAHKRSKVSTDKPRPKRKPKPRPKHHDRRNVTATKPVAQAPGDAPAPKSAKVGVRDPWATSAREDVQHLGRKGEARENETAESEDRESTDEVVAGALGHVDETHLGLEAISNGGSTIEQLAEEQTELFAGELGAAETTLGAAGAAIAAPVAIAGGAMELIHGIREYDHDVEGGTRAVLSGAASAGSGVATIAALGGSTFAAGAAPLLGAFGGGVKVAGYGSEQVNEAGWLHDQDGKATTPSSWSADRGEAADHWVTKHTHSQTLGTIAGAATSVGTAIGVGAPVAIAGAVNGGLHRMEDYGSHLGRVAARDQRASAYSGANGDRSMDAVDKIGYRNPFSGQVTLVERASDEGRAAGRQMAEYDDERDDAVERAKMLHPEQWGESENVLSMSSKIAAKMRAIGGRKDSK